MPATKLKARPGELLAPDRAVVEAIGASLRTQRTAGVTFATAWARAMPDSLDRGWSTALNATREAWRAAYQGEAPAGHHGALWALADSERAAA